MARGGLPNSAPRLSYGMIMIRNFLRARGNRRVIEALHGRIVAAARNPALFLPPYAVPDTLEGRFDLLVLLATLIVRRLENLPDPGREIAQGVVDCLFQHLDSGLREMGVGDLAVPKRMKKLAGDFGGRGAAYRDTLGKGREAFAGALARNIYGHGVADERALALADYARRSIEQLERADLTQILDDPPPFPDLELTDVGLR
jgi:cytochrome b pre-mRNA-processing protein 3